MKHDGRGLLVGGRLVLVDGLDITAPAVFGGPAWCALDARDHRARKTSWVRQLLIHTTQGAWPQTIARGIGRGGTVKNTADFWHKDPEHSGAHIGIDDDGKIFCLADLLLDEAYHATSSNLWSVGIEMRQAPDKLGTIYEATLVAMVKLALAICRGRGAHYADTGEAWNGLGIPLVVPARAYSGHPLRRMLNGGPDVCGVLGHRDNTERRGRGDPGDEPTYRLIAAGAEPVDFDAGDDLKLVKARQIVLNRIDPSLKLVEDGVWGPATDRAARRYLAKSGGIPWL